MATHKGHFRWHNEEEVYGKAQWTRVYFVLKIEERALYIYKQKKDQSKEWKKIDVSKGSCENGRHKRQKHVFVFTANDQRKYVFRSEHKNKKKQWVRYLNDAAKDAKKVETPKAAAVEKEPEPVKKADESSSSDDESSSSDDESSSSEGEDEDAAAAAAAAAKKKADEEAEAAAAAKKKADDEAAAAAAAAAKKAEEEAAAAAAAKKEAEKEESDASSSDESSSSDDSSSSESEAEEKPKDAPAPAAEPEPEVGKNVTVENTYPRLIHLQGKKKTDITFTHVAATGASVNDTDIFVLDDNKTVYTWLGASPNMWQKQAAAALTRAMDDERGSSVNNLVISNPGTSDAAKFWELLGGKPETLSKSAPEAQAPVLFRLSDASGKMEFNEVGRGNPLKRSLLAADDVFIADLGFHIFVWIGKKASRDERDKAVGYAVVYRQKYHRPQHLHIERVMDGGENELLYSFFQ